MRTRRPAARRRPRRDTAWPFPDVRRLLAAPALLYDKRRAALWAAFCAVPHQRDLVARGRPLPFPGSPRTLQFSVVVRGARAATLEEYRRGVPVVLAGVHDDDDFVVVHVDRVMMRARPGDEYASALVLASSVRVGSA